MIVNRGVTARNPARGRCNASLFLTTHPLELRNVGLAVIGSKGLGREQPLQPSIEQ